MAGARHVAARLSDLDPGLSGAMEQALAGQERPRYRGLDANLTLTLASFLLGLVQFGWSVYQDHRQDRKPELREVLIRRLTMRIEQVDGEDLLPPGSRGRVVEVVAEEILSLEPGRL